MKILKMKNQVIGSNSLLNVEWKVLSGKYVTDCTGFRFQPQTTCHRSYLLREASQDRLCEGMKRGLSEGWRSSRPRSPSRHH